MSRSSKKQLSETELLHKEIKELREINKALSHKLKEEFKKNKTKEPSDLPVKENLKKKDKYCEDCSDGKVIHRDIGPRILVTCTKCDYRKVIKNAKEETPEVQSEVKTD